ncbi:hypothetical protein LIA77_00828 [Sarocladium implicatum]|nr:hypothetical protein LIA77_00828 [Sarocladium implicatum]
MSVDSIARFGRLDGGGSQWDWGSIHARNMRRNARKAFHWFSPRVFSTQDGTVAKTNDHLEGACLSVKSAASNDNKMRARKVRFSDLTTVGLIGSSPLRRSTRNLNMVNGDLPKMITLARCSNKASPLEASSLNLSRFAGLHCSRARPESGNPSLAPKRTASAASRGSTLASLGAAKGFSNWLKRLHLRAKLRRVGVVDWPSGTAVDYLVVQRGPRDGGHGDGVGSRMVTRWATVGL